MRTRHLSIALIWTALFATLPLFAEDGVAGTADRAGEVLDAHAAFEALKGLEGTWVGTVTRGDAVRQTKIVYEVSAAGHSLIQTFAPGSENEMFSVYHMDGDELLMTHYCALGNAPKMKFEASGEPGQIAFAFAGGTNLDPEVDAHAHEGTVQLLDADSYQSTSIGFVNGAPSGEQTFRMKRQRDE